ncbi:MAG0490 family ComEA-like DNA-binding protein [[Mycoplasma] mobile]|uniref:Competance locus protein ComEA n=1 Tax=Mycoplasma mobile (strain ATCC 43663 / 163K / NCTC 11711) TaxID=267748 RepID=Q6KHT3_MYCM1|nr:helix-hairpin-helix domain-containing protein [[Mycoplasma] mobile]AAT27845.1 competance locus protein ComEA [Mycoplasma mobile 163K]
MKRIYFLYSFLFCLFASTGSFIWINQTQRQDFDSKSKIKIEIKGAFKFPGIRIFDTQITILDVLRENEYFENADFSKLNLLNKIENNMVIFLPFKTLEENEKILISKLIHVSQITSRGINLKIATEILEKRNELKTWNEISLIKGIGPKTLEKLKEFLII